MQTLERYCCARFADAVRWLAGWLGRRDARFFFLFSSLRILRGVFDVPRAAQQKIHRSPGEPAP